MIDLKLTEEVERRIKFLIELAVREEKRDQVATMLMRVLSNYATVGRDGSSAQIKNLNKLVSTEAKNILLQNDLKHYRSLTINEHPKPLKETWLWLQTNARSITTNDVWNEFKSNPMVTISKSENSKLRAIGMSDNGNIITRYAPIGIDIIRLDQSPSKLKR